MNESVEGRRVNEKLFMINLHKSMVLGRDRARDPWNAVRYASVARHVTDCARLPGTTCSG